MEKFCLKWDEFQMNATQMFSELREDFCDVTLITKDNQKVEGHKIILAASSPWFRNILKNITNPCPVIYLRDLKATQLSNIMDYIYHGEVNIYQDDLDAFLALAEELQVKGLAEYASAIDEVQSNQVKGPKVETKKKTTDLHSVKYKERQVIKKENTDSQLMLTDSRPKPFAILANQDDFEGTVNSMIEKIDGLWSCKVCGKTNWQKVDLRRHAEVHIEGASHPCATCGKEFRF